MRACLLTTPASGVVVSEEPDTINRPGRVPEGDGRVQEGWRQLSRQVEVRGERRRENIEQGQGHSRSLGLGALGAPFGTALMRLKIWVGRREMSSWLVSGRL